MTHEAKGVKTSSHAVADRIIGSQVVVSADRIAVGEFVFEYLLSAEHVSLILGLGDSTLRELEEEEELVPVRVRRQRRYPPQVLRDYLNRLEVRAQENKLMRRERKRLKEMEAKLQDPTG